ncbi:MAG: YraN family protein [Candidatus Zixiibacteriota bacterium]
MSFSKKDKSSPKDKVRRGREFETLAAKYFTDHHFTILDRNWQAGHKEIDLVVRKDDLVVFVEVKSAGGREFGHPVERVDNRKVKRLTSAAREYLQTHDLSNCDFRFDVVTFLEGIIEHFSGAFQAEE